MPAAPLRQLTATALGAWVAVAVAAPAASAQTSVKAVFEKYGLAGTFAVDCTKPATRANIYFVTRVIDAGLVQRDRMSATTTRDFVQFIDKAGEAKANDVSLGGTRDDKPFDELWHIERKTADEVRYLVLESAWGGNKVISGGKVVSSGQPLPWLNRCGK
jgi:hypothetical protein